jgi:hypothetical protein
MQRGSQGGGNPYECSAALGNLLVHHPGDGPSLVLLSHAVNCLVEKSALFSPIWELRGK